MIIYPVVIGLFVLFVSYAAVTDLLTMRIPNWISVTLLLMFAAVLPLTGGGVSEALSHLQAGLLVFAAGFVLFAFGWMGGGDVKLSSAVALWMGWELLPALLMATALLGGALTLALLLFRRFQLFPQMAGVEWVARLHDKNTGVPYGVAIAGAALLVLPETIWVQALLS